MAINEKKREEENLWNSKQKKKKMATDSCVLKNIEEKKNSKIL
jgi:hypothetical protein